MKAGSRKTSPYVAEAVEEFLRTKSLREEKTRTSYSSLLLGSEKGTKPSLGTPFAPYFHGRRMHHLSHDDVSTWFAQRVQNGAQDTKHRMSKASRNFLRFCQQRGHTKLDLASAIDPYRPSRGRTDALSWDETFALLDAISEYRHKMAATWLFLTGCRVGEAVHARQMDIRRTTTADIYQWSIPHSKTDQARSVRLPDRLAQYIDESRARNEPRPTWPILWDCDGRGFGRHEDPASPVSAKTINAVLERAADRAGILIPVTAHTARHTYCTLWITEQGDTEGSIDRLSHQVGTDATTLRRTYVHVHYTEADWQHVRTFGSR